MKSHPSKTDARTKLTETKANLRPHEDGKVSIEAQQNSVEEYWSGPLHSPRAVKEYESIIPGSGKIIIGMAQSQNTHRIEIEKMAIEAELKRAARGQWFAFIIAIAAITASTICTLQGHDWAIALGVGGLTGLVSIFLKEFRSGKKELEEKDPD